MHAIPNEVAGEQSPPNFTVTTAHATIIPYSKGDKCCIANQPPNCQLVFHTGLSVVYTSCDRPGQVCKVPSPIPPGPEAHEIERRIYQRLAPLDLPHLVRVSDMDSHGIWMEQIEHGCLRNWKDKDSVGPELRLQWCEDVARVLAAIHRHGVRHADLSARNLLVDGDLQIWLCDFSGSAIDEDRAIVNAEAGYRHPNKVESHFPTIRCEVHSLGSTLYEIVTGHSVYHELEEEEIEKKIEDGEYPSLANVPLADIIAKCWSGDFTNAEAVADAVALVR